MAWRERVKTKTEVDFYASLQNLDYPDVDSGEEDEIMYSDSITRLQDEEKLRNRKGEEEDRMGDLSEIETENVLITPEENGKLNVVTPSLSPLPSPLPIASTSNNIPNSTSRPLTLPPLVDDSKYPTSTSRASAIDTIIIDDTSSEDDEVPPPKNGKQVIKSKVSPSRTITNSKKTSSKSNSTSNSSKSNTIATPTISPTKVKPTTFATSTLGRKSIDPRLSLEKALLKADKLNRDDFYKAFPTITSYISFLKSHTLERYYSTLFEGCRICFINPLMDEPNEMDTSLKLNIALIHKHGGTLVAPEDFIGAPTGYESDLNWKEKAEKEGWTTHIIVHEDYRILKRLQFNSIFRCLPILSPPGTYPYLSSSNTTQVSLALATPPSATTIANLGDFVTILSYKWAQNSIGRGRIMTDTSQDVLVGDLRKKQNQLEVTKELAEKKRDLERMKGREEKRSKRAKMDEGGGRDRGKGKGKVREEDSASSAEERGEEEEEEDEDGEMRSRRNGTVSPFGSKDYPSKDEEDYDFNHSIFKGTGKENDQAGPSHKDDEEEEESSNNAPQFQEFVGLSHCLLKALELDPANDDEYGPVEVERDFTTLDEEGGFDGIYSNMGEDFETDDENQEELKQEELKKTLKREGKSGEEEVRTYKAYRRKYACEQKSTGGAKKTGSNENVARQFDDLSKVVKGDIWRERGYRMAAGILRNQKREIRTFSQAIALRGIGESIAKKIVEVVKTGHLRRLDAVGPKKRTIELFSKIFGVGSKIAEDLYSKGARKLEDLKNNPRIVLTDSQKLGLRYYDDLQKRIPRDEVTALFDIIVKCAAEIDPKLDIYCMGSYRRVQSDCGDIDIMITRNTDDGKDHHGQIHRLWERLLEADGVIKHGLASPQDWQSLDAKFNGLCCLPGGESQGHLMRRIDIFGVPRNELPAALIALTGNDFFNRSMRLKARHLGYRLNQKALYRDVLRGAEGIKLTEGTRIPCQREEDIFKLLQVPYRPPHERLP